MTKAYTKGSTSYTITWVGQISLCEFWGDTDIQNTAVGKSNMLRVQRQSGEVLWIGRHQVSTHSLQTFLRN